MGGGRSGCFLHYIRQQIKIIVFLYFAQGAHTIAVVNGPESRETLAESFKEVFKEVNDIQDRGYITVDGNQVDIELFLGGDYKVIITTTKHQ